MEGYRKSSHAVYRCEYHFVWIPKYRYQVLIKEVKSRLKQIFIELCEWMDIDIIEGAIASDHVSRTKLFPHPWGQGISPLLP